MAEFTNPRQSKAPIRSLNFRIRRYKLRPEAIEVARAKPRDCKGNIRIRFKTTFTPVAISTSRIGVLASCIARNAGVVILTAKNGSRPNA